MFIDTHTHIYTTEFDDDHEEVISRAVQAGAQCLLLPNIDLDSISPMLNLYEQHPDLCRPMMGLHPTELPENPEPLLDHMERLLEQSKHPFVAIGEVGIDLYWDNSRCMEQIAVLRRQAEWAVRYQLPLVIHSRSAHRELVDTLLPFSQKISGIFHCFGGTADEARELLEAFPHFMLGIGGVLTFKKSTLPAVLRTQVPLNRLVVETDAPYLAPTPHRGKRNEPAFIPLIIDKLTEIYELPTEEVERQLLQNTLQIFPKLHDK